MNEFTSKRCQYKRLEAYHRKGLLCLFQNEKVRAFLGGTITEEQYHQKFNDMLRNSKETHFVVFEKISKNIIGLVSITEHYEGEGMELSYMLLPEFWSNGYGKEMASFTIRYGFKYLKLPFILAETQKKNTASNALLKSLGMQVERDKIRFGEEQWLYKLNAMCSL